MSVFVVVDLAGSDVIVFFLPASNRTIFQCFTHHKKHWNMFALYIIWLRGPSGEPLALLDIEKLSWHASMVLRGSQLWPAGDSTSSSTRPDAFTRGNPWMSPLSPPTVGPVVDWTYLLYCRSKYGLRRGQSLTTQACIGTGATSVLP